MSARLLAAVVHVPSEKLLVSNGHGVHGKPLKATLVGVEWIFTFRLSFLQLHTIAVQATRLLLGWMLVIVTNWIIGHLALVPVTAF